MDRRILVMIVAAVASTLLATPFIRNAFATEFISVNFDSIGVGTVTSSLSQAGESDNWLYRAVINLLWEGDFEGTAVLEVNLIFHNYGTPDMTYDYRQTVTFAGTFLQEYTGTLTVVGGQGYWRITSGTDELSDLRGHGTMQLIGGRTWSFAGQVHFAP
jgi:hypothetical protein